MTRLSTHVEALTSRPYWERIASFDCLPAARAYATQCKEAHPNFQYRVKVRTTVAYDETFIAGEAILQAKLGDPT